MTKIKDIDSCIVANTKFNLPQCGSNNRSYWQQILDKTGKCETLSLAVDKHTQKRFLANCNKSLRSYQERKADQDTQDRNKYYR